MSNVREITPPPLLSREQRAHVQECIDALQNALNADNLFACAGFWVDRAGEVLHFRSNTENALGSASHGITTLTVDHHSLMSDAMDYSE